jgi:hypothetical protein
MEQPADPNRARTATMRYLIMILRARRITIRF